LTTASPNSNGIPIQATLLKIGLTMLSIPLMRMELLTNVLPKWLSDFSFGLMFRLGILFGLLLLIWQAASVREFFRVRSAAFLVASVGSAWAAVWLGRFTPANLGMLEITVSGAICLAASHKFILRCSWIQAIAAVLCAPGLFHLTSYLITKGFSEGAGIRQSFGDYMPCYWQFGYLLGMFGIGDLMHKGAGGRG
jgi:hypothetical protein